MNPEIYWALAPDDQIGKKLVAKLESYGEAPVIRDLSGSYATCYQYAYGLDPSGIHATSRVLRGGEQGELAELRVNHARSLVNTLLNLIVAPKVVWDATATNIDYESLKERKLAASVLEYYWREHGVSRKTIQALEQAIYFREGFVLLDWDETAGEDVSVDENGQIVRSGDAVFRNVAPWDVRRDPAAYSYDDCSWFIVTLRKNRFDLAALYTPATPPTVQVDPLTGEEVEIPAEEDEQLIQLRDAILKAPKEDRAASTKVDAGDGRSETDDVPCYYFFHKRTPAVPDGKQIVFLGNGAVLANSELQFDELPLYRVSAGEMVGTPFGYSPFLDILGIQELMDSLHTSVATNQSTLATQCIAVSEGSHFSPEEIAGGMRVVYVPAEEEAPRALQLTSTPGEVFTYLNQLKKDQELVMGLNSIVRGEPQSGEQSGSALALLSTQALQQASVIQGNYLRFVEQLGNGLLCLIRKRLGVEKTIGIVGRSNAFLVTETGYSGESFKRIKKVQVVIGNPLSQTAAGRDALADKYIALGFISTPQQVEQVHETGKLDPLTEGLSHELMLIRSENEDLAGAKFGQIPQMDPVTGMPAVGPDGLPIPAVDPASVPPVLVLDDHRLHIREHRALLANPQSRRNPALIQAVLAHIQQHETALTTTSPVTLMLAGQEPLMPMGPPPGGPPGAPPPTGGPPAPPGNPNAGQLPPAPKQPKNPATGQTFDPKKPPAAG